jgi:hypothetical protein
MPDTMLDPMGDGISDEGLTGDVTVTVTSGSTVAGSVNSPALTGDVNGTVTAGSTVSTSQPAGGLFFVGVDWAKNGSYAGASDDVTDRVRPGSRVTASYGRDQDTALSPIVAGRGSFDLDNRSRDYSPRNVSSPLYGNLKPARPVIIQRTVSGIIYVLLVAHTTDDPINPDVDAKTVSFTLEDALAAFKGQTVSTALYSGIRTGDAIGYILDAVGWTGGRDLDAGVTVMPWWWEERADAFEALTKLLNSEGPPALLTVGTAGEIIFRDRHHRLTRSASLTSQATWSGTEGAAEPVMGVGFTYDDAWRNIVNSATFSVDVRVPATSLQVVWETEATIDIPASSTVPVSVELTDPVQGAAVPSVSGKDYSLLSGTVTPTLSRTSGTAITIFLAAGGVAARITNLRLRAYPVPVTYTVQVSATDATSQTDYGLRSYPAEAPWAGQYDAKAIADLQVATRKQPNPILNIRFPCGLNQDARLTALLTRDLSDRVTVVEPETAVNSDFFLESFQHSIDGITDHQITVGAEAVPPTVGNPAIMFQFDGPPGTGFNDAEFAT